MMPHKMSLLLQLQFVYVQTVILFPDYKSIAFPKRLFVFLWCLPFARRAYFWLKSADNPLFFRELLQKPEIREFLYRPYVNKNWNAVKRMDMITEHYRLVNNNAPILNLAPDEYIDLVCWDLEPGKLRVVLDRPDWMRREGEIGLSFFLGVDRIYSVMFLLSGTSSNMKLIIGCVQGNDFNLDPEVGHDLYKNLTKAMYGMRPRDFILNVTKMIGDELGCEEILGVSDAAHRSAHWLSKAKKHASYDTIWQEHGGKKSSGGFFTLTSKIVKRADLEIPSQKRALYHRRYQFLDELQLQLRQVIACPPSKNASQLVEKMWFGFR